MQLELWSEAYKGKGLSCKIGPERERPIYQPFPGRSLVITPSTLHFFQCYSNFTLSESYTIEYKNEPLYVEFVLYCNFWMPS